MADLTWPGKDPDEVLDYTINWSRRLPAGDTIAASSWIFPTGLTMNSAAYTNTSATVWISGGTTGTTYKVTNRVTTTVGRTMDQTVSLTIIEK